MKTLMELRQDRAAKVAAAAAIRAEAAKNLDAALVAGSDRAAITKRDDEFAGQLKAIDRQIELIDADIRQAEASAAADRTAPAARGAAHVEEAWEKDRKRGYRDVAQFLGAVMRAEQTGVVPSNLKALRPSRDFVRGAGGALATAGSDENAGFNDASLGFMVPDLLVPGVLTTPAPADPLPDTLRIPMAVPTVRFNARTDKNHSSSVSGGLRVYRRAESQTIDPSKPQIERVELSAFPLMGVTFESEELLQDAPAAALALIQAGFRDEFLSKRIQELISGTGVGEYLGIDTSSITIDVAKETAQAAGTIVFENLTKMLARLWGQGRWIANRTCLPQLAKLNAGTNGLVWQPSAREGVPDMLLGLPLGWTEYCATLGTVGDIRLVNMSQYLEGTRQDLQTEESMHVRFLEHERTFKFSMRTGGTPWWRSKLTPKNGDTLSPFVRLATRA